jgi:glucosamine-6-phosphate deaminase
VLIHPCPTASELGLAAALDAAASIRKLCAEQSVISVVFATGASQLETLRALTTLPDIPWESVIGFHMDEYIGISDQNRASFRRYLRDELVSRVPMREFHEIDGNTPDPETFCCYYANLLRTNTPALCLLGIGENGHLAFNDPSEADFNDPKDAKVVALDQACRRQQVNEGWFASIDDVPQQAITLTIPALLRIPELILSVPGVRKREIVRRTLQEPISTSCPATILRTHPDVRLYVDHDSYPLE